MRKTSTEKPRSSERLSSVHPSARALSAPRIKLGACFTSLRVQRKQERANFVRTLPLDGTKGRHAGYGQTPIKKTKTALLRALSFRGAVAASLRRSLAFLGDTRVKNAEI